MKRILGAMSAALALMGSACAQVEVAIDRDNPIGVIAPEVYGQFLEHLGKQPYGSIWVGPDSDIPNTDGIRDDVFAALDALDIPVIRWPGGCYADLYHWQDGVGPQEERPLRLNLAWGGTEEPNSFGTHEFFNLAERLGAKTYLNLNLGTGSTKDAASWLEYITAEKGDRAALRAANGRAEPWKVDYLTIGNETWGCGGNLTPGAYADMYTLYMTVSKTAGEQPMRVISGSHDGNIEYSEGILEHPMIAGLAEGISVHFYTLPTSDWSVKGAATGFPEAEWISTMQRTLGMADVIDAQRVMIEGNEALGEDFRLYVDEWGAWYDPATEDTPALNQQNTIRDAVVAALNFHIFHENADIVAMTNIAQMVDVLQAMILTDGPDMVLTPTYHAYHMHKAFMGATALPVSFESPDYTLGDVTVPAVSVSAAVTAEGATVVSLVNADAKEAHRVSFGAKGASAATGRQLTGDGLDDHNTFDDPERVTPVDVTASVSGGTVSLTLPPRSVTVLEVK